MNIELVALFGGIVPTVVAYRLGARGSLEQERRAARLQAALELAEPLRELRSLVRRHGRAELGLREVASAYLAWAAASDRHIHRLPQDWRHLSRSIRAAVGTVFGGVTFVDLRPDTDDLELAEPDFLWQTFTDDYIDYTLCRLLTWGDSAARRRDEFWNYDTWLVRTGRRKAFGQNEPEFLAA